MMDQHKAGDSDRLPHVDWLRIFAALTVCMGHLGDIEAKYDPAPILPDRFNWSVFGVDMFFVISGYLMVMIAKRRGENLRPLPYLADRAARIYPIYWLVTTALVVVWLVRPEMVFSSNPDPVIWASYLLWPVSTDPLHALGYSLVHFMYFYIVFAVLAWIFKAKRIVLGLIVWAALTAALYLGLVQFDMTPTRETPILRLITHPFTYAFILGGVVAGLPRIREIAPYIAAMGMACVLVSMWAPTYLYDHHLKMDMWGRLIWRDIPFALAIYGAGCYTTGFSFPLQRKLADISFAIILIHVLTFSLVGRILAPSARLAEWDNILAFVMMFMVTLIAAWIAYDFFENPICRWLRSLYRKTPTQDRVI